MEAFLDKGSFLQNGEMAQWFRALIVVPEELYSIPSATWWLTTICKSSSRRSNALLWLLWHQAHMWYPFVWHQFHKSSGINWEVKEQMKVWGRTTVLAPAQEAKANSRVEASTNTLARFSLKMKNWVAGVAQ